MNRAKMLLYVCLILGLSYTHHFLADATTTGKIFIASIPKAGTHLLIKLITLMTNKTHISSGKDTTLIDETVAENLHPLNFINSHALCNLENQTILKNHKIKGIFILRDPRDLIVSLAFFMQKTGIWCPKEYMNLSIEKLISLLIHESKHLLQNKRTGNGDIDALYRTDYLPWIKNRAIYTTSFEHLVGPHGGGTKKAQLREIMRIAEHIYQPITREQAEELASKLFGDTWTFREGKIGGWKKHFTESQKREFKCVAGKLLIELGYEKDMNW